MGVFPPKGKHLLASVQGQTWQKAHRVISEDLCHLLWGACQEGALPSFPLSLGLSFDFLPGWKGVPAFTALLLLWIIVSVYSVGRWRKERFPRGERKEGRVKVRHGFRVACGGFWAVTCMARLETSPLESGWLNLDLRWSLVEEALQKFVFY